MYFEVYSLSGNFNGNVTGAFGMTISTMFPGKPERAYSSRQCQQQYDFGHVDFDRSAVGMHRLRELYVHEDVDVKEGLFMCFL